MLDFLPHSVDELAYLRVLLNANNHMSSFGSALSEVFGQNWSKQVEVVRFPSSRILILVTSQEGQHGLLQ